jgi:hypothetical protein
MLVGKSSKTVHTVTHKDMMGSVTVVACVNAHESHWMPSMVPRHAKGITGWKSLEIVLRQEVPLVCLQKSKTQQKNSAKFHVNSIVNDEPFYFPMNIEFILISVYVMKGRRLTPTLSSCFLQQWAQLLSLKFYWNEALDNYRKNNFGRRVKELQFPKLLADALVETAAPIFAVAAFESK